MRFIRYQPPSGAPGFGWVLEERVGPLEGSPFAEFRRGEALHTLDDVRLLAPIQPSKILCVGRNYVAHTKESPEEVQKVP